MRLATPVARWQISKGGKMGRAEAFLHITMISTSAVTEQVFMLWGFVGMAGSEATHGRSWSSNTFFAMLLIMQ